MALFLTFNFEADNLEDALSQVLFSSSIPKNVQKISTDIIENFPEERINQKEVRWVTNDGDRVECYYGENGWEFSLESKRFPQNLLMCCDGRIDYSNAIPPQQFNGSPLEKIFQYEQMIKGKYTERGALFDANGNIVTYSSGGFESVFLPAMEDNAVYATHSHPDIAPIDAELKDVHFGSPFSPADFNLFLQNRNLKQIRVVFSNGVVMVCEKTKPKLTNSDINRALELLSRRGIDKVRDTYMLSKGNEPTDNRADMNRKIVKFAYELDKSTAANLGLHIYFYLKDGRLVEHLKGKKITTPKKKHVMKKPTVKKQPIKSPVKKAPVRKRVVRRSPAIRVNVRRMF